VKPRAYTETLLLREILRTFGARPDLRLFRNSVGLVRLPGGGAISFGLCVGSSDLVGWRTNSSGVAQFVAIEVKAPTGRLTPDQDRFLAAVRSAGGLAGVARSLTDVEELLAGSP
jgi:hypothetical protein